MSGQTYDIAKRRVEYIKFGNKELIKKNAGKEHSQAIIDACQRFLSNYIKPRVTLRADGNITLRNVSAK